MAQTQPEMSALGDKFRLAREARGLSLSSIAEKIHIRSVYLDALERGDWTIIGAPVYVRGFLRTYARYLNIDPEAAIAEFREELGPGAAEVAAAANAAAPGARPSPLLLALALVAIALAGYAGYTVFAWKTGPGAQVSSPATAAPVAGSSPHAAGPAAASPAPAATLALASTPQPSPSAPAEGVVVRFTARSWVRVAVDGATQMEGIFPAGTERSFRGKTATIRVGNAGGVDISANGKNIGTLGGDGEVAERTFTLVGN